MSAARVRPGDAPVAGPAAAAAVRFEDWRGLEAVRLLYHDLDLAERADLRRALGPRGPASDADLVRLAVERWGLEAPAHLGGAFAFAAWDGRAQRVVGGRDAAGVAPLLWAETPGGLVVGGDVRAVTAAEGVPDALDDDVMAATLLSVSFYPALVGRTHVRAVREVPAGHGLEARPSGVRTAPHWRPEEAPRLSIWRPAEVGEALRAVLREVVAEAVADVPDGALGGHLSGGLDSASVLAFAAETRERAGAAPPVAFAWAPPPDGRPSAEHDRIGSVVERWALPVAWCPATVADHLEALGLDAATDPAVMWAPEAPVRREAAERGVRVVLSGWGGDEGVSFTSGGRAPVEALRQGHWGRLARWVAHDPVDGLRRLRNRRADPAERPTLEALRDAALRGEHATFARPEVLRRADLPEPESQPVGIADTLAWLLRRGHLGRRTAAWALAGAPHGVRYRFPLLDRRVLRFVHGLPPEAWLTWDGARRWPLRAAGAGVLPDLARLEGGKAEPRWQAASRAARVEAARRVAPRLRSGVDPEREAYVDVEALGRALAAWAGGEARFGRRGLHATGYVRL